MANWKNYIFESEDIGEFGVSAHNIEEAWFIADEVAEDAELLYADISDAEAEASGLDFF